MLAAVESSGRGSLPCRRPYATSIGIEPSRPGGTVAREVVETLDRTEFYAGEELYWLFARHST